VLGHYPCRDVAAPRDCSSGSAIDINELGVVLGWSLDADGRSRAFVWKKGVMQELDVFPGRSITPVAINDREQILGRAGPTVFLWDQGRTQIIIESDSVAPQALGSHGEVIGVRLRPNNHLEAWVWRAGLLTELGPGLPTHINKAGDIIGYFSDDGYTAAILWRKRRMGAP